MSSPTPTALGRLRVDQVGSLLRPLPLKDVFLRHVEGEAEPLAGVGGPAVRIGGKNPFTIPYHPAAVRFYRERGVWKPEMEEAQRRLLSASPR